MRGGRAPGGYAAVVCNGYQPEHELQTGIGPVTVRIPKVRSRSGEPVTFHSALAPPYVRKTRSLEAALPWLYLKGVSSGEMGFWAALEDVYPETKQQRCWMHKTVNVLNALPKASQPNAKQALHDIWKAETKAHAEQAFDLFLDRYEAKYPKATACLQKDREELLAFYCFPAKHRQSLRTSNPIESAFGAIRHRTKRSKGCLSRDGMLHMMFKLGMCAEQNWRKLRGFDYLAKVITALIPWDIAQKLDQLSEREGRSKAWFIRLALTGYRAKVEELDQSIQEGMDAQEDGDLVGHEEVEREIEQWQRE